uniref:Carboxypeptidase n=1 Tax=Timema douglasi TaxID=61478 RepID=A0A7R8VSP1_TIMDO|nr:unnamed protein product [Timema douglasi]
MAFPSILLFLVLLVPGLAQQIYPKNYWLRDNEPVTTKSPPLEDVGDKLVLTPYLRSGKIQEAQKLSRVLGAPFPDDIPSYSGFFTVNEKYDSNLFFWFFPAQYSYMEAPVLLWLQGGPGTTSLYGLFKEMGPFTVAKDNINLVENPFSYHKNHSLLFTDNPVGAGFSYTNATEGYARNQTQIGDQLYSAVVQFFTLFPELQNHDFFITGESYAGLVIGNGFTDPLTILNHGDYAYQLGLIDLNIWGEMKAVEDEARDYIANGNYYQAFCNHAKTLAQFDFNAYVSPYNVLYYKNDDSAGDFGVFVQSNPVRRAIHVGSQPFGENVLTVYNQLMDEYMVSVKPWVEELLDNGYRVFFYNGQLDYMCGYPMLLKLFQSLNFNSAQEYTTASRKLWTVSRVLAGYTKTAGNFTEILVRNSGHYVPYDQPEFAFDLIYRATRNTFHTAINEQDN